MHSTSSPAAATAVAPGPDPIVSSASAGGASVAAALARRARQSLIVVDAVSPLAAAAIAGAPAPLAGVCASQLLGGPSSGGLGVTTEQRTVPASPAMALTAVARDECASLIVIEEGPRRRGLLRSLPLRTALRAAAPVLALRESGSLLRWLHGQSTLRIMVAIDRTDAAPAALDWASAFAGALPAEIVAVCLDPSVRPDRWDGATAVLDAASQWRAELIVVGIRRAGPLARWRRRSAAERVVDEATTNVVAVPCA